MDKIWGKLKEPTQLSVSAEEDTKSSIRQKVWETIEKNDIANFPRPVYNRIPNFKGANIAGQKVIELEEFKKAKIVKVNPDKPQEEVRYQVLDHDKTLIVPTPRLAKGLFNRLSNEPTEEGEERSKETIRKLASREGIDKKSKPVPMASRIKIDLVVIGSVAVDRFGRRIGKGEGFADLEFAMGASHHGAVSADTVVITTVHDIQVFDELPPKLFEAHDLPVDVIVTPTEVFRVKDRLTKPDHIIWSMLTREKFNQIPILRELQFKEQKAGKIVQLKDEDNENGDAEHSENSKSKTNGKSADRKKKAFDKKKKAAKNSSNDDKTGSGDEITPKKKQSNGDTKSTNSAEKSQNSGAAEKNSSNGANGKPKKQKQYPATVSVFVGKIPRGTRVKELKEVIIAKGVKPINILWKGGKGYALIYCEKKEVPTSDELFEKLKNLTIGDNVLNVEPDKRIKPTATKDGDETTTKIIEVIETVVDSEAKNKNPTVDVEAAKQVKPIVESAKQVKPIVEPAKQVKPIVEPAKQVKPIIKDEQVKPTAKIANGGATDTADVSVVKTPTSNES